jgi:hypothetical protein
MHSFDLKVKGTSKRREIMRNSTDLTCIRFVFFQDFEKIQKKKIRNVLGEREQRESKRQKSSQNSRIQKRERERVHSFDLKVKRTSKRCTEQRFCA